jgi:hypothetical protein
MAYRQGVVEPEAVINLARERNIHPAIIVGRIQRRNNNFRLFSRSLGWGQGEVRKLYGMT